MKTLEGQIMWLSWHYHQESLTNLHWILKQHFVWGLLDLSKTQISWKRAFSVHKTKSIYITTNKDKLNIHRCLYTKYIKLYTTHTYELPKFSSMIGFPGNSIFKSSKWLITLTDLSSNLICHEPFETQNDSTTLFSQNFLHLDHKNL